MAGGGLLLGAAATRWFRAGLVGACLILLMNGMWLLAGVILLLVVKAALSQVGILIYVGFSTLKTG